ncbi:N-acetyltransferase [Nocardioides szechwanensis]|nr:N-acetyltransferase [Nocardioides szechwanensis]
MPALFTERVELRAVQATDLHLMVALNADPRVMTYIRGRAATAEETRVEWRRRLERQSDPARGLGYWAGFEQGTFLGWWSASSFEGRPEISGIGHRLFASAWGRGLATEGARAMVAQAFGCPDIQRVLASTNAANAGSQRVLEKLGMTPLGASPQKDDVRYELSRASRAG